MAARVQIAAANELKPLVQGSLSRLCGLYSILNAVRLALHPFELRQHEVQATYLHGLAHLSGRRLLKRVLGIGMDEQVWLDLGNELLTHVNASYCTSLRLRPTLIGSAVSRRDRALQRIMAEVRANRPVLLCLGRALDHFTVVCGYSGERLTLFDSSGFRWIGCKNIGLGDGSRRSHWISASSTFTLIDDW
jgi:hypothetical protein